MSSSTVAPVRRRGAGLAWTGVLLLIVGLVMVVVGGVQAATASGISETFTSPVQVTPAQFSRTFDPGTYVVFERAGSALTATIDPSQVSVVGPDGASLTVGRPVADENIDRGSASYVGVAAFEVGQAGAYDVSIASSEPTEVFVAPGLVSSFSRAAGWIGLAVLGGLLLLVGIVLAVVGLVLRGRSRVPVAAVAPAAGAPPVYPPAAAVYPPAAAPATPAGWYPDPERPGGQRWWDGTAWSDHRA